MGQRQKRFPLQVPDNGWMQLGPYEMGDLEGVIALCEAEGWPSFATDPERTHRVCTAPGVTSVVARDGSEVIGFAYLQSDGEVQAHLSLIVVSRGRRREGIARQLLQLALDRAGGQRIDLITDSASEFYEALPSRTMLGYRIYPPFRRVD